MSLNNRTSFSEYLALGITNGNASIATSTILIDRMNLAGIAISVIEKLKQTNGNA